MTFPRLTTVVMIAAHRRNGRRVGRCRRRVRRRPLPASDVVPDRHQHGDAHLLGDRRWHFRRPPGQAPLRGAAAGGRSASSSADWPRPSCCGSSTRSELLLVQRRFARARGGRPRKGPATRTPLRPCSGRGRRRIPVRAAAGRTLPGACRAPLLPLDHRVRHRSGGSATTCRQDLPRPGRRPLRRSSVDRRDSWVLLRRGRSTAVRRRRPRDRPGRAPEGAHGLADLHSRCCCSPGRRRSSPFQVVQDPDSHC